MMALNANEDVMMAWNVETEDATLNVDLKTDDGSERRTENTVMALNAETEDATLNVDLKTNDGSERRTEKRR